MKKQEVFDYFCDRPEEEVLMVLEKLGLNVESEEFPEDVVEKAESVFNIVDKTAKALPPSESEAITLIDTANVVTTELEVANISIPQDVIYYLAQSAIQQLRADAKQIAALSQKIFVQTLKDEQEKFYLGVAEGLQKATKQNHSQFNELADALSNQQDKQPVFDVQSAISKLKAEQQQREQDALQRKEREENSAKVRANARKIDVDAFFKEING